MSVPLGGIDHEDGEQLGRFGFAGVFADAMAVARHFRKAFAGLVDPDGAVVDLAADRAFEDGGVDEGGRRMVWPSEKPPGAYSTRTPFMLLPGTFGSS